MTSHSFLSDLRPSTYLNRHRSLFRHYQDRFLAEHGAGLTGRVVELGGERHWGHARFFPAADSFVVTNVARDRDEHADLMGLPWPDGGQDAFVCVSVLEHVEDPATAVAEIARTLRPGGVLLATVPFLYPRHDTVDHRRWTAEALVDLLGPLHVDHLVSLGGRLSTIAELCQRPVGRWRRRDVFLKVVGLPVAVAGRWDTPDDSPLGFGVVARR